MIAAVIIMGSLIVLALWSVELAIKKCTRIMLEKLDELKDEL